MKSGNKEAVGKKLDDDMDAYWEKKAEKKTGEVVATTEGDDAVVMKTEVEGASEAATEGSTEAAAS